MNKEHYTPEISDLKIGYECEICTNYGYESFNKGEEKWEKVIIGYKIPGGYNDELCDIIHGLDDGYQPVRVKYLTKEQIEKEGWNYHIIKNETNFKYFTDTFYTKDNFILRLYRGFWNNEILSVRVTIMDQHEGIIYKGSCPSINEMRYICKLLNI